MDRALVKNFLSTITNEELIDRGDWVMTKCPMAHYTHTKGTDNIPSFGISVSSDKESVYHCFTCSEKAHSLIRLIQNLWLMFGEYPIDAARVFGSGQASSNRKYLYEYKDVWKSKKIFIPKPIPKEVVDEFTLLSEGTGYTCFKVQNYLLSRGISRFTMFHFGIRYCDLRHTIIFPYTFFNGDVYSLQQRKVDVKVLYFTTPKLLNKTNLTFFTLKESGAWFGLNKANLKKPVVLVEGAIDAMKLYTLGIKNVIASCNAHITDRQFSMLTFPKIILGYDMDMAGDKARKLVISRLQGKVPIMDLDWRYAKQPIGIKCEDPAEVPNSCELNNVLYNAKSI